MQRSDRTVQRFKGKTAQFFINSFIKSIFFMLVTYL